MTGDLDEEIEEQPMIRWGLGVLEPYPILDKDYLARLEPRLRVVSHWQQSRTQRSSRRFNPDKARAIIQYGYGEWQPEEKKTSRWQRFTAWIRRRFQK